MHFLYLIGGFSVMLANFTFIVYKYRTKHNKPLIPDGRDKMARDYPVDCPCGCGLKWAADMPTPPHYTEPPTNVKIREINPEGIELHP